MMTSSRKFTTNRRYGDACAVAHALELIGDRWALLVTREMMLGPRRFSGIRRGLAGISANVLTQRLEELEAAGIVERQEEDGVVRYALTPWGQELEAVTQALGRWGARSPGHDPSLPFSATSLMLSMRTMIDEDKARALGDVTAAFIVGPDKFVATLKDGDLHVVRGIGKTPDFTLTLDQGKTILPALYGPMPLTLAEAEGRVAVSGDADKAQRFLDLFALPQKVAV